MDAGKEMVGSNWLMIACEKAAIECYNVLVDYYLVIIICYSGNIDDDEYKIDCWKCNIHYSKGNFKCHTCRLICDND